MFTKKKENLTKTRAGRTTARVHLTKFGLAQQGHASRCAFVFLAQDTLVARIVVLSRRKRPAIAHVRFVETKRVIGGPKNQQKVGPVGGRGLAYIYIYIYIYIYAQSGPLFPPPPPQKKNHQPTHPPYGAHWCQTCTTSCGRSWVNDGPEGGRNGFKNPKTLFGVCVLPS